MAGAILAGAGRRGVGGALGTGVGATEDYMLYPRHFERITMSRVLLGEGQDRRGARLPRQPAGGRPLRGPDGARDRTPRTARAHSERLDATNETLGHLERALTLAEPEGFVRVFVDEGLPMAALLEEADPVAEGRWILQRRTPRRARSTPGRLLEHIALQTADSGNGGQRSGRAPGLEHLSGREVEVLELVAAGRSNAEIAGELYLSVGTVKARPPHLRQAPRTQPLPGRRKGAGAAPSRLAFQNKPALNHKVLPSVD